MLLLSRWDAGSVDIRGPRQGTDGANRLIDSANSLVDDLFRRSNAGRRFFQEKLGQKGKVERRRLQILFLCLLLS